MEANTNNRKKINFQQIKQPNPDLSPEIEEPFMSSHFPHQISLLKQKNNEDKQVIPIQTLEDLSKVTYENAKTISTLLSERKTLIKQYHKMKYRKYRNDLDMVIIQSISESNGNRPPNSSDYTYEDLLSLQEKIGYVKVGFSEEEIQRIPTQSLPEDETCSICFNTGNTGKVLNCGHFFHEECIGQWLAEKKSCPLCLNEVFLTS